MNSVTWTDIIIGFVLTFGIGLSVPLLIRFVILRKPVKKNHAILISSLLFIVYLIPLVWVSAALEQKTIRGIPGLAIVIYASYYILRKGYKRETSSRFKNREEYEAWKEKKLRDSYKTEETRKEDSPPIEEGNIPIRWDSKQKGIALVIIGICIVIVSFSLARGYRSKLGLLWNFYNMEVVLKKGEYVKVPVERGPGSNTSIQLDIEDPFKPIPDDSFKMKYVKGLSIPYRYCFITGVIVIAIGTGMILIKRKKNHD